MISCETCAFFLSTRLETPCDKCIGHCRFQKGCNEDSQEEKDVAVINSEA